MTIKTLLIPIDWLPVSVHHGYGNGYIGVPPEHPWFGQSYDNLYKQGINIDVHGGLTYSQNHSPREKPDGYWWLGFDTCHLNDDHYSCPKEYVEQQIESLKKQALDAIK